MSGHQPNLLPWIGYFEKINRSDVFVFADDVQFAKQTYTNRVSVSLGGREQFLILPVQGQHTDLIRSKLVTRDSATTSRTLGILSQIAYESDFRDDVLEVVDNFEKVFGSSTTLSEINLRMIQFFLRKLRIQTETIVSSDLQIGPAKGTARIIERCLACGANCYLSGQGSAYIEKEKFADWGIDLIVIDYLMPSKMTSSRSHLSIVNAVGDFGWEKLAMLFRSNLQEGSFK